MKTTPGRSGDNAAMLAALLESLEEMLKEIKAIREKAKNLLERTIKIGLCVFFEIP